MAGPNVDLSRLSTSDLEALQAGDLSKVSTAGLMHLKRGSMPKMEEPAFEKEARELLSTTPAELIAANPMVRVAVAAARPFLGAADLIERTWGGTSNRDRLRQLEEMQRRGNKALGFGAAGTVADVSGAVLSPLAVAAAKAPQAAGQVARAVQAGEIGGLAGLTAGGDNPLQDAFLGAAVSAPIPGLIDLGGKVGRLAYHSAIEPWARPAALRGRAYLEAAGDKADDITRLLRENRQIVPGSAPTAGEAAVPAASAEFSALQDAASKIRPTEYVARTDAQNAARLAALRTVGKDKAALTAAERIRAENAAENYGPIMSRRVSPQSDVQIMDDAIASRAASKAEALRDQGRFATTAAQMEERGANVVPVPGMPRVPSRVSNFPERVTEARSAAGEAAGIASTRRSEQEFLENTMERLKFTVGMDEKSLNQYLNRPSMREAVKAAFKSAEETGNYFPRQAGDRFSVQNLQRMKEALDDAVKDPAAFGIKATEAREMEGTRKAFVDWLSNKVPEWKAARLQYTEDSIPINQMQVGQYLETKLRPALDDLGRQKPEAFAQAVQDVPGTLMKRSGVPLSKPLQDVLTPEQMGVIQGVQGDLARMQRLGTLAQRGLEAAPDISAAAKAKLPNMLERATMVMNAIVTRLEGRINKKIAADIAAEMLNPPAVAETMAAAAKRKAQNEALARTLEKLRVGATVGGIQAAEQ